MQKKLRIPSLIIYWLSLFFQPLGKLGGCSAFLNSSEEIKKRNKIPQEILFKFLMTCMDHYMTLCTCMRIWYCFKHVRPLTHLSAYL